MLLAVRYEAVGERERESGERIAKGFFQLKKIVSWFKTQEYVAIDPKNHTKQMH